MSIGKPEVRGQKSTARNNGKGRGTVTPALAFCSLPVDDFQFPIPDLISDF
jgi:hypothetical protein